MTPVPLDLPLRPPEAAELGNLIFDQAERKPLTDEVRNRIAARAAVLRLETIKPFFGSLERDPVHPSVYYVAVDGEKGEPLLLHLALATAPTSSIFYKALLIGRMRRANGPEMVINAVPFGPRDSESLEKFCVRMENRFLPRPQGPRAAIAVETQHPEIELPVAFEAFRAILKRTGKNLAAVMAARGASARAVYDCAVWVAIRAGWRDGYTVGVEVASKEEAAGSARCSLFRVRVPISAPPAPAGLRAVEQLHEHIRQARAAIKLARPFDLEVSLEDRSSPTTPEELGCCLHWLREQGHAAQLVAPRLDDWDKLPELAAVARQYQATLSVRGTGPEASMRVHCRMPGEGADLAGRLNAAADLLA